jgi:hypothetical protein
MIRQILEWQQLTVEDNPEFQKIVKLLTEFDDKTGRFISYANPESHYARKAIAIVDPTNLKVYVFPLGGYVYSIVAECTSVSGYIVTAWVHEDGIRQEREDADPEHPVHKIVCLTDLFERAGSIQTPSNTALTFMQERIREEVPA